MPEISIIIPNYNTEKYLPRCLDSLINQTFQDIEIIVIDDGSKDTSVDVVQEYAKQDKRIKLIQQQNSGPAKARNQGMGNATGKYLMFCDSDDWYESNMCKVMYDTIEKQKVDVVCCHNFFDWEENLDSQEKEGRLSEKYYNPNKAGEDELTDGKILSTNVMLWNKIWRRDLIEKYNIRFPEGHEHDDDAFWYMYAMVAKNIFYLKTPLYHYFLRSGSIMSTQFNKKPKNRMDRIAISEYVLDFVVKHNLQKEKAVLMSNIFRIQLKNARKFFTAIEIKERIRTINYLINHQLGLWDYYLVYSDSDKGLFLKNKNKLKLIFRRIWYRLYTYISTKIKYIHKNYLRKENK